MNIENFISNYPQFSEDATTLAYLVRVGTDFTVNYPQFAQKPETTIAYTIGLCYISCPVRVWGYLQATAVSLLSAHVLTAHYEQLALVSGTAGTVAAGNQVTFPSVPSNPTDNDAFLSLTVYGLQLKNLKGQLAELASWGDLGDAVDDYYDLQLGNTGFAF